MKTERTSEPNGISIKMWALVNAHVSLLKTLGAFDIKLKNCPNYSS